MPNNNNKPKCVRFNPFVTYLGEPDPGPAELEESLQFDGSSMNLLNGGGGSSDSLSHNNSNHSTSSNHKCHNHHPINNTRRRLGGGDTIPAKMDKRVSLDLHQDVFGTFNTTFSGNQAFQFSGGSSSSLSQQQNSGGGFPFTFPGSGMDLSGSIREEEEDFIASSTEDDHATTTPLCLEESDEFCISENKLDQNTTNQAVQKPSSIETCFSNLCLDSSSETVDFPELTAFERTDSLTLPIPAVSATATATATTTLTQTQTHVDEKVSPHTILLAEGLAA